MVYIIFDLEATCWKNRNNRKNEIIEIGAVCVDKTCDSQGEFCQFVSPFMNPILSDFCTQLTSITQKDIEEAPSFPTAVASFKTWLESFGEEYILCSWGHYDRVQLKNDCQLHGVDWTFTNHLISLKHQYAHLKGKKRPKGMKGVLKAEKIQLDGTHHRGIDDARNILKIFIKYFNRWDFLATYANRKL